jgi:4,5-dihydroxyphthalate decarboxylase
VSRILLSLAIGDYDHVRDLVEGRVRAGGIDLVTLSLPIEEIFFRFTRFREWDASEMSFGKLAALATQAAAHRGGGLVALPVFPSRAFRHSSIYVRADSGIEEPRQLSGRRVGLPEWAQTAAVYTRGMLVHEYGVELASIEWRQAGVNQAGRLEKVALQLPAGVRVKPEPERSLSEMLLAGELDAVLSARAPAPFVAGDRRVRRLFADPRAEELAYYRRTGIYPIMHVLVLRRAVYEENRWIAANLCQAFEAAKQRSLARLGEVAASFYPLPWMPDATRAAQETFGADPFPYGVEPNRRTLEAFLQYAHEQGVTQRRLRPEELFAPETLERARI